MGDFDKGEMYENEFEKQKFEQFFDVDCENVPIAIEEHMSE